MCCRKNQIGSFKAPAAPRCVGPSAWTTTSTRPTWSSPSAKERIDVYKLFLVKFGVLLNRRANDRKGRKVRNGDSKFGRPEGGRDAQGGPGDLVGHVPRLHTVQSQVHVRILHLRDTFARYTVVCCGGPFSPLGATFCEGPPSSHYIIFPLDECRSPRTTF